MGYMILAAYEHGDRNINEIALTFDDGPNPFWTHKFLDLLDKDNIKANFFIRGQNAELYPEIVKESFKRGHLIGNHTYSHPKVAPSDFEKAEEIIFSIIGEHTKFVRPPYFLVELCENYLPAVNGEAKIINCDVLPKDYENGAEDIKQIILKETQNGSIIGLHDGAWGEEKQRNRPIETFKALPEIIEKLKERFSLVRLDEMTF